MSADDEKLKLERQKLDLEYHKNRRDEQFWFTLTTITFNGLLLVRAEVSPGFAVSAAAVVSGFAGYLVMTRWLARPDMHPAEKPERRDSVTAQWRHTRAQMVAAVRKLPCAFAELSGTAFHLFIILVSLVGVICKHWCQLF